MATKYLHKRTLTAGKVPAVADVTVGEIVLNTVDGKAFVKTTANAIVTLNPDQKIWVNGTLYQRSQLVEWVGQGTTDSNGRVTIYPTQNQTAAGTIIFSQIVKVDHEAWLTNGTSATVTQVSFFNVESATPSKVVLRGATGRTMLLLGDSVQFAPAGINVIVRVIGLP